MSVPSRWAWAEIDLDAVAHNVAHVGRVVEPSAVWAVVKANGYGHGAVEVARVALDAGAAGLCVALVQEGVELRDAGIDAPILVLSQQPEAAAASMVAHDLVPTVYSIGAVDAVARAAAAQGRVGVAVHVKVDTGMQRVGAQPAQLAGVLERLRDHDPVLRLGGMFTHLAVADEPDDEFTGRQLERFDAALAASGVDETVVVVHAANSAGSLAHPRARRSLVRAGIAIYGISPGAGVDDLADGLRPAMSLRARVAHVKRVVAGSRVSYGLRHTFDVDTVVATVPIGYADGVPRRLSSTGGEVLIGGRRCPIVGVVTMDQLVVDCGPDASVAVGDEVVLIGEQDGPDGLQRIRAEDWATRLGTIGYEVVCGISSRVPRIWRRSIDGAMVVT